MTNKMTLEQAREAYQSNSKGESNKALACTKIAICVKSARTVEEAVEYLQQEIKNCNNPERRGYYYGAIEALS